MDQTQVRSLVADTSPAKKNDSRRISDHDRDDDTTVRLTYEDDPDESEIYEAPSNDKEGGSTVVRNDTRYDTTRAKGTRRLTKLDVQQKVHESNPPQ